MEGVNDHRHPEERLAELLRMLPPAPRGWVEAAQELPAARLAIETLVERAVADRAERLAIVADLEAALEAEGVEPTPERVAALRRRLADL
jgi:hypothetical protein